MSEKKLSHENKKEEKKKKRPILTILFGLLFIICGLLIGYYWSNLQNKGTTPITIPGVDNDTVPWKGDGDTYGGEKNPDVMAIPGFDSLNFKAGVTEQAVSLYNPNQNTCYFKMSLILADGTKLWESNLVEPGQAFNKITLNQSLPVGTYENTVLKYKCFSNSDGSGVLNGSEVKFNLNVK